MNRATIKRLIHADPDYCLPHKEKVNPAESLSADELLERMKYGIHHFSKEYNLFLNYLSSRNTKVLASQRRGQYSWTAVYDLGDTILSCFFDKSESPQIEITIFSE